jgi:hypothetical protein
MWLRLQKITKRCRNTHAYDWWQISYSKYNVLFIDLFHLDTKSDACVDGAGCHYFENTPKTICVDDAELCPVTCGCCSKLWRFHRLRYKFAFYERCQNDGYRRQC